MCRTLLRNREDLHPDRLAAMWNTFLDAGVHGEDVLAAWIAKEELRMLFTATCAGQVRDRLHAFFSWCATHDHIPELVTLAETISRWREEIAAAIGVEQVLGGVAVGHAGVRYGQSWHLDDDPPFVGTALIQDGIDSGRCPVATATSRGRRSGHRVGNI